jgi:nitrite reductase/ring-hydroxylating ferredoxin subunit
MATWHAVATVGQLRPNDVIAVHVGDVELVIGLDAGSKAYFAMQRRCLHQGGDLADGIVARGHLVCPMHGWRFSTETGAHETASSFCLTRYPVRVTGDTIEVEL